MDDRFEGKGEMVVGGAGAIGSAIARRLAAEGATVVVADLDLAAARSVAAEVGGSALEIDVTDEGSVRAALAQGAASLGALDGVVSCAGYLPAAFVVDTSLEDWSRSLSVNATGSFLVVKHSAPLLREAGGGAIVLLSSTSALGGAPGEAAYAAAKGAVISLTKVAAVELASAGIRVNSLCPGWVDTPFNDPVWGLLGGREAAEPGELEAVPLGRQGRAEEIAAAAAFLLSDDASYVTGVAWAVDGGSTAAG